MTAGAPMVGLLYNPAVPLVLDALGPRVDYVEVVPDRLWYDFGAESRDRFSHAQVAIDELRRHAEDRCVIGHGIGLSLPSAMPLDEGLLDEVAASSAPRRTSTWPRSIPRSSSRSTLPAVTA